LITHVTADFLGVSPVKLTDTSMLSGLLVSAAGASGLSPTGSPLVRRHPDGALSVILPLDGCHMSLHTMPAHECALLDIMARAGHDPQKALDVCARRLEAREVRAERRERG
jgi:S-adenosylmethionine/arginine decarboxylase-like enzyme